MTIQEAIKTGKPFRRKSDIKKGFTDWYLNTKPRNKYCFRLNFSYMNHEVIMDDILATDWEIKK